MPAVARAATVNVSGCHAINNCDDQHFTYTAAPGETNDLRISVHSTGTYAKVYDVEDPGAVILLPDYLLENPPGAEDPICARISDNKVRCSALGNLASGAHTTVTLGDRNDAARVTPEVHTVINGDAGDDTLSADGWVDELHGGDGDDTLVTTDNSADRLFGEGGDDTFRTSQPLDRTDADGGPGSDTFDFSNRSGNVVAAANSTDTATTNGYPNIENFLGGSGDDTLTGDGGPNTLAGGRGDDTLRGLGDDDTLDPGPGLIQEGVLVFTDDDIVDGGDGTGDLVTYQSRTADLVIDADGAADDGASGEDDDVQASVEHIHGGSGDDALTGNASDNVLNGWTGTDVLDGEGGSGDVASYEGRSADLVLTLDGSANDGNPGVAENDMIKTDIENIWGGRGDDDITGNSFSGTFGRVISGVNELRGGFGDDDLDGAGANDTLLGNGSTERLLASDDDRLDGGPGNDRLEGDTWNAVFFDPEADDLIGGDGADLADYSARGDDLLIDIPEPPASVVSPPPANNDGRAGENDRVYSSVENVTGGAGNDTVTGSSAVNLISGGTDGRDSLTGGGASDTLNGGGEGGAARVPGDTLNGGAGTDTLDGGADNDVLNGGDDDDVLDGGPDNDTLNGDAGDDALEAGGGSGETLNGHTGADSLSTGSSTGSTLSGGEDGDRLSSTGAGSGSSTTTLSGGPAADTFTTGTARDDIIGGGGTDHISYAARTAAVTVTIGTSAFDDGQSAGLVGDDRVHGDVENVTGGPSGDSLTGDANPNRLDGGPGGDTVVGGEGADALLGGTEDDHLTSRDASADQADCGAGAGDKVTHDSQDTRTGCERAAPNNTAAPAITGTARDGATLSAAAGSWEGEPTITYAYRWRRCDDSACADIAGTAGDDQAYAATPADVGRSLRVRVTASNGVDAVSTESAPTALVEAAPPANTAAPGISGTARDGEVLAAAPGTWSGTPPLAYGYQWRSCDARNDVDCSDIAGATAGSYRATPADVGRRLRVRVTATNVTGPAQAATADSDAGDVVMPAPPLNTAPPAITGETGRGRTLTADPGAWSGTPTIAYGYQWRSCDADSGECTDIAGATARAFVLTSAEVARRVRVRVTATNAGGAASAESAASRVVIDGAAGALSIVGVRTSSDGRATVTVAAPGPGVLSLVATSPPAQGARFRPAKRITVARIVRIVSRAGHVRLTIKPSRRAMVILRKKRKLKVGVRVSHTPAAGDSTSQARTITLRLGRRR